MIRVLFLGVVLIFHWNAFTQNVVGVHHVEKATHENEYLIKTSIKGLKQVDIAKFIIVIDSTHQFKKAVNNAYFFDRDQQEVKFYIIGVPPSGEINLEFSIVLAEQGNFIFPVILQYSKNEEKKQIDLAQIKISNEPLLAIDPSARNKEDEQEKLLVEQKLEEDKLAKNIARFNEEQERINAKELADKQAKEKLDQDNLLAEQKQKELAEAKRIADEKAKREADEKLLADQKAKELADKIAKEKAEEEKLLAEQKQIQLEEAKRITEEKAKREADEKLLADQKAKEIAAIESNPTIKKQYSVQLLSLSSFSEERLTAYCKKHNLPKNEIIKRSVGATVKISYGKVNTQEAATELQQKLKRDHQIESSFIVVL